MEWELSTMNEDNKMIHRFYQDLREGVKWHIAQEIYGVKYTMQLKPSGKRFYSIHNFSWIGALEWNE